MRMRKRAIFFEYNRAATEDDGGAIYLVFVLNHTVVAPPMLEEVDFAVERENN